MDQRSMFPGTEKFRGLFFQIPKNIVPVVKYKFIKSTFIKKFFSSKSTFIKNHFHQKPLSSKTTFIKNHFHQKPISSKTNFIRDHFHQKPISSKTNFIKKQLSSKTNFIRALPVRGTHHPNKNNIVRVCVKASPGRRPDAFTQTRLVPTFGVSAGLFVEHCRPKAGNVQQKGPLRVQRWVFRF